MKHIYRLHNVHVGYVLYRALVNHVMVINFLLCHTISKNPLIAESCNYTGNNTILYEIRDTLEYWEDPASATVKIS